MPHYIHRFAALEETLDTVLFRRTDDDESNSATPRTTDPATIARGTAGIAATAGAGLAGKAALDKVKDRISGLRSSVPGFTGKSNVRQGVEAVADLAGQRGKVSGAIDATKRAAGSLRQAGGNVAKAANATVLRGGKAYTIAREVGGMGRVAAGARSLKKAANPLLSRLGSLAAKLK